MGTIPRRCVNLPPGGIGTLVACLFTGRVRSGPALESFARKFGAWLGVPHVFGAASGRSAFQLALEALALPEGSEVVFPALTFPVMPLVAEMMGLRPVFCDVDPTTYDAGPEHIEPVLTERTRAVLATHLFGRPCPIVEIADLLKARDIRLLEDCAHACGVRVGGKPVGTFGDVGVFSFAEGKNMPCFGGGAIATADEGIARRARNALVEAPIPGTGSLLNTAVSVVAKWFFTRPLVFGVTVYPVLRLRQWRGQSLMDSSVGDDLLLDFRASGSRVQRLGNLQAALGVRQLDYVDAFNEGARRNARVLTEAMGEVEGVRLPPATGEHIYVYFPLTVDPDRRDDLRRFLLRRGIDAKLTDMADCRTLTAFREKGQTIEPDGPATEATLLEICVYPVLSERQMRKIAEAVRAWSAP